VGETRDVESRTAYVTTLRAREQDIRREKATSNVCTNQTLMAVTAAIQLGWLGTSGLVELARRCAQATHYLRRSLLSLDRVEAFVDAPVVREFAVRLPVRAAVVIERMADAGFLAGISPGRRVRGRPGRAAHLGDRTPDPGRDRCLHHGAGQGGGVMTEISNGLGTGAPGGKATSAPLLGREAEPTLFELSHRAGVDGPSVLRASRRWPSTS